MSRPADDPAGQRSFNGFNPVLGFLSVSTCTAGLRSMAASVFQTRAGFSECLDSEVDTHFPKTLPRFQSRAGFSECLDHIYILDEHHVY